VVTYEGPSTRRRPRNRAKTITFTGNGHMLPVTNKPTILYGLEHLINVGIKDIGVILGTIKEGIVESLGDGSNLGSQINPGRHDLHKHLIAWLEGNN